MNKILRAQGSFVIPQHAELFSILALGLIAIGILLNLGAADVHQAASHWVLRA